MSTHGSAPIAYSSTNAKGCMHTDVACNKKRTRCRVGYLFPAGGEVGVKKSDAGYHLNASLSSGQDRPDHERRNPRSVADCLAFAPARERFERVREGPQRARMQPAVWSKRGSSTRHGNPHSEYGLAHVGVQR